MSDSSTTNSAFHSKCLIIACLIVAGEMIFSLPFHVARYFRPTVLSVFDLSNGELGDIFALYGITAMLAYFPGGAIADYVSARKLITLSLIATSIGGLYLATIPSKYGLYFVFAYWGVTTIFLFWGALIRATREWGGHLAQGRAFGLLDGGRGLVAASAASLAVLLFSLVMPDESVSVTQLHRTHALQIVMILYIVLTFATGMLIWFSIPDSQMISSATRQQLFAGMKQVLGQRIVWLQSVIVICAYCGYKGLDNYGLYAFDVLGMDEVESARFTSIAAFLRPIAAIAAGIIADRIMTSRVIGYAFVLLLLCYMMLAFQSPTPQLLNIIYVNLVITFMAVFALRGVYFALLEETGIRQNLTGTTVGLVSLAGFTPDIFFVAIAGRLLDASPGITGHQHFFALLATISAVGIAATLSVTYYRQSLQGDTDRIGQAIKASGKRDDYS